MLYLEISCACVFVRVYAPPSGHEFTFYNSIMYIVMYNYTCIVSGAYELPEGRKERPTLHYSVEYVKDRCDELERSASHFLGPTDHF